MMSPTHPHITTRIDLRQKIIAAFPETGCIANGIKLAHF